MEHYYEEHVKPCIDNSCYHKEQQRTLRIPHCPQNCGSVVVHHKEWHSQKIYSHVKRGLVDYIIRRIHEFKCSPCKDKPYKEHHDTAYKCECHGTVHRLRHLLILTCCIIPCRKYISTKGYSYKKVDKKVDERCRRANRRESLTSAEISYHYNIDRIKHKLQYSGQHKRKCKRYKLVKQSTVTHVYLVFFIFIRHLNLISKLKAPLPCCLNGA